MVDMRTADDSDTEMVDLTESPEKNDVRFESFLNLKVFMCEIITEMKVFI